MARVPRFRNGNIFGKTLDFGASDSYTNGSTNKKNSGVWDLPAVYDYLSGSSGGGGGGGGGGSLPPVEFTYTGTTETYVAPGTGSYKLEVWGAKGGNGSNYSNTGTSNTGGSGGYSSAYVNLTVGDTLYICCGQLGGSNITTTVYTFNGGAPPGNGSYPAGQGGGATHIAISTGELKDVPQADVVIVAGGGGGGGNGSTGGAGGGLTGGTEPTSTQFQSRNPGSGGSQTTGGANNGVYGRGGIANQNLAGGGGGGWYGGGGGANSTGGGGGSGRISSTAYTLTSPTTTAAVNTGAGKATITKVS